MGGEDAGGRGGGGGGPPHPHQTSDDHLPNSPFVSSDTSSYSTAYIYLPSRRRDTRNISMSAFVTAPAVRGCASPPSPSPRILPPRAAVWLIGYKVESTHEMA